MMEQLTGVIERITFHNLENGYCVLRVVARGHRDLVTVVGHMPQVVAGEFIEAQGEWIQDRTHGPQFKALELRTTPPHTQEGIIKYLSSGLVKGIGPKYARKIVEVFGEKTLEVIERTPASLGEVKGIGAKRVELIRSSWKQNQSVHRIMTFLHSYGIGTARAVRIYKTYGENAVDLIKQNPYRLSNDIWGVGFKTADELALKMGLPHDAPQRVDAAVRHVLREGTLQGHVALPETLAVEQTSALADVEPARIAEALFRLVTSDEIIREPLPAGPAVQDDALLYLKSLYLAEVGLARSLMLLREGEHPMPEIDIDKALGWAEEKMRMNFAPAQRTAVSLALRSKILVLTGGPGTGKTTIVRAILELIQAKRLRVELCAPTGRAAKRLSESTGREARTIHRLLEFDAASGTFRKSKDQPLDLDVLIVDESSMMDVVLANQLLRAVPGWAAVLFVGDVDQLPSVGAGAVLADMIASGSIPVARLTEVHRQASTSYIIRAAHAVNAGELPESAPAGQGDFYHVLAETPEQVIEKLLVMVRDRIPARFGLDPFRDIQVLSPMNRMDLGVQNLNRVLQDALNPVEPGHDVQRFGTSFRKGDKVIQTQNNYQREVFNGDIGRIALINTSDQVLTVDFEGRAVDYDFAELDELQLAYAISIHKSQGSEYPVVVIPVHTQHWVMLQRNLLYTGLTRGRKLVVLVGSEKALAIAVRKVDQSHRFSLLRDRLRE